MGFGWINVFGAVIVILMLIPNIVYALKNNDSENKCNNKLMNIIEQVGRYACIALMWLPLLVWKFGFSTKEEMLIYIIGNTVLLAAYIIIWILYFERKTMLKGMALAIIPTCIFLLSGLMLRHWLLVVVATLFGIGHIYVTYKNRIDLE